MSAHDSPVVGTPPALDVRGLNAWYGKTQALFGVDLSVSRERTVAVVGTNGAGKTTLLRSIVGLTKCRGEVWIDGTNATQLPGFRRVRRHRIAMVHEGRGLYYNLSVVDNIRIGYRRLPPDALARVLDIFPDLRTRLDEPAGRLSGGQQQMVALARLIAADPQIILLDEPGLGLSPRLVDGVYEALARIRTIGATIVLVEQNIDRAAEFATEMCVMAGGRVIEWVPRVGPEVATRVKDLVIGVREDLQGHGTVPV